MVDQTNTTSSRGKQRVVILGSGFGAIQTAKNLKSNKFEVTMISPRNHFLFTPLLIGSAVGTVEARNITEPVRLKKKKYEYFQASCIKIQSDKKSILCKSIPQESVFEVGYDKLVIAIGANSSTFGVEGVKDHAVFLKEAEDARKIRKHVIQSLEQASLPGISEYEKRRLLQWVIVGGGPTGSEFAGELHDFVKDAGEKYPKAVPFIKITLLEAMENILPVFDQSLQEYAEQRFRREGIEIRKNETADKVLPDAIVLKSGEKIPCSLVVWSTGVKPHSLVTETDFPKSEKGFFLTDQHLRVKNKPDIFAIGDTAQREENPLPATAQVAQQQGKFLGKYLTRISKGKALKPFDFHNLGKLAYLGGNRALADLPKGSLKGRTAWLFWRSVYLFKLVGVRNRIRVLGDWINTKIFGRETSHIA